MATNDAIFIAKKRLEYFLKCNLLGYPLEAVEEDCCSSCSPHNAAYETPQQKKIQMPHGAFQLLRVKNRYPCRALYALPPLMFFTRSFSELNPPGGYRDVNIKLKIGFRSSTAWRDLAPLLIPFDILFRDCESSRNPLFLPVQEWNEQAGVKRLVVEVQLHLKVRRVLCRAFGLRLLFIGVFVGCICRVPCLFIHLVSAALASS